MQPTLKTFLLGAAFVLSLLLSPSMRAATADVTVNNSPTGFVPGTTNINLGDTVKWTWPNGSVFHNVTSSTGAWTASQTLNGPATFSVTFSTRGTFPYSCTVHGFTGKIIVITNVVATPPNVSLTNPPAGTVFALPANLIIRASASDTNSGGSVTNVQFLVDASVLANVTAPPYLASTNGVGIGGHTLSAVAANNLGLKATNSVSVTVDAPPAITITNPVSGTVLAEPANILIQATASDTDGSVTNVQFTMDTTILANLTSAPYSALATNQTAGSHVYSAIASDNFGLTATNSVTLNIVTPVPLMLQSVAHLSGTGFQFNYSANTGLTYIVQAATDLSASNWINVFTNTATTNPVSFHDTNAVANPGFYRVVRQSNP